MRNIRATAVESPSNISVRMARKKMRAFWWKQHRRKSWRRAGRAASPANRLKGSAISVSRTHAPRRAYHPGMFPG